MNLAIISICPGQKFLHLLKHDMESIFQTESWDDASHDASHSSALFFPLTEDVMVNTRNIEQFRLGTTIDLFNCLFL